MSQALLPLLEQAFADRRPLFEQLHAENTDCYRLFHGANEGCPGLTVDRYGDQLLIQSFHQTLADEQRLLIEQYFQQHIPLNEFVYNDRSARNSRRADEKERYTAKQIAHELGVTYRVQGKHAGQDPLLFLDMRAGRRYVQQHAKGRSVLNLFSYTCGVGVCAALAGASEVWNIDFAERNLAVGEENAELNGLNSEQIRFIQSDYFTAAKQLAGIPVKQRVKRGQRPKPFLRLEEKGFDLVYLDPPRWAKSAFGTVDLIRDYQSVFKPALLATNVGGQLICTNNVAQVQLDEWLELMQRAAVKAGRPISDIELIAPESDFPSPDGRHPLKIAVLSL